MSDVQPLRNFELILCLRRLLDEAEAGRMHGISYTAMTPHGLVPGFAGRYSGRRLVMVDDTTRIVAVDDPHPGVARKMGAER